MDAVIHLQSWPELTLWQNRRDRLQERVTTPSKTEGRKWTPALEMQTTDKAIVLRLEVPGIEAKNLDVQVREDAVFIKGDKAVNRDRPVQTPATKAFFHSEINYGRFERLIPLPVLIVNDRVEAKLNNGILTLTLPKRSAIRPQVVKVNIGKPNNNQRISPRETTSEIPPVQGPESTDLEADPWAA